MLEAPCAGPIDKRYGAHLTSDGSLCFFALVTLMKQRSEALPGVLFLDEPELGLNLRAIAILSGLLRSLATDRQIIVATQCSLFVDEFDLDQIQVLDLEDGQTRVRALASEDYSEWLDDHSAGELWEKNLLGEWS